MSRVTPEGGILSATNPASFAVGRDATVYLRGTTTKATVYDAESGGSEVTQPLRLVSGGRLAGQAGEDVWFDPARYTIEVGPAREGEDPQFLYWEAAEGGEAGGGGGEVSKAELEAEEAARLEGDEELEASLAAKQDAAGAATDAELAAHSEDTTSVHGIADTSALALKTEVATDAELAAHEADTTSVHGIADTTALATKTEVEEAAGGVVRVIHGSEAGKARPEADMVIWFGTVAPENSVEGDAWFDTSSEVE